MPLGNVLQALIVLAVVLVGSVFVGNLFRRIRQPAVVGVIFFGLLLGTILAISPHSVNSVLLSPTSKSLIDAVGQAGLLLLLFLVGIELRSYSKTTERSPLWQLLPCVLIPVVVCAAAAFPFAHRLVGPDHNPLHVWLFVGVALSVTAWLLVLKVVLAFCAVVVVPAALTVRVWVLSLEPVKSALGL